MRLLEDIFTPGFWTALFTIVIIDLVLAGDNALVIGMAARNLPKERQKKVIFWGTAGAIIIRALLTLAVVTLLKIPLLRLIGGLILVWIAIKLLIEEEDHDVEAADDFWGAVRTIIIADAVMGLDNVLAVAGAAQSSYLLVVMGLLISIPIVVWGSTLFIKLVDRFPWVLYFGAGVLGYTAASMIVDEPLMNAFFDEPVIEYGFIILMIAVVILTGYLIKQKKESARVTSEATGKSEI